MAARQRGVLRVGDLAARGASASQALRQRRSRGAATSVDRFSEKSGAARGTRRGPRLAALDISADGCTILTGSTRPENQVGIPTAGE